MWNNLLRSHSCLPHQKYPLLTSSSTVGASGSMVGIWWQKRRPQANLETSPSSSPQHMYKKNYVVASHMTNYLTFVIIDQRIVLYQCKTKTVKSLSELFRCDKCNFHRKKVQISKPDGGRTQAAKSVTGRQKNDRRGPECPYYVERCKCSRSEHVKRSLNQTRSLLAGGNAGYSFDPQVWPTNGWEGSGGCIIALFPLLSLDFKCIIVTVAGFEPLE